MRTLKLSLVYVVVNDQGRLARDNQAPLLVILFCLRKSWISEDNG